MDVGARVIALARTHPQAGAIWTNQFSEAYYMLSKATLRAVESFGALPDDAFVDVHTVAIITGAGVSTVWGRAKHLPDYPKPIRVGPRNTKWRVGDIRNYLRAAASRSA